MLKTKPSRKPRAKYRAAIRALQVEACREAFGAQSAVWHVLNATIEKTPQLRNLRSTTFAKILREAFEHAEPGSAHKKAKRRSPPHPLYLRLPDKIPAALMKKSVEVASG
jgi:hypothetical protein